MRVLTALVVSAALAGAPGAFAQTRGASGVPEGSGNPLASLSQMIYDLQNQMRDLRTYVREVYGSGGSSGLAAYDAAGRKVGDVVGVEQQVPLVSLSVEGKTFVLKAFPNRLVGNPLYFATPDCSGTPYVGYGSFDPNTPSSTLSLAAAVDPNGVVYVTEPNAVPAQQFIGSQQMPQGHCVQLFPQLRRVLASAPLLFLDEHFTRPYAVR
jgi:hypothetical protein